MMLINDFGEVPVNFNILDFVPFLKFFKQLSLELVSNFLMNEYVVCPHASLPRIGELAE